MKTFKVLLLEDMSDDFSDIEKIIGEISSELAAHQVQLELLYNYDCSLKLISNFVASETMETYLQKPFKDIVLKMAQQIKAEDSLICLLDIVWTKDAKEKLARGEKYDEYGCTFYCVNLNEQRINKNTLIVSALTKKPSKMQSMRLIPKVNKKVPFGEEFKKKLKTAICALPIVNITEPAEPKIDV